MRTKGWVVTLSLGLMLASATACHFSVTTANLSALKLGKDKTVSQETSSFAADDTVYAVAVVSNVPDKVKVKARLAFEDVPGQTAGPIPGLETTLDLGGSGTGTFTFSPPNSGWPKGKYKVEVFMLDENGDQKDQKANSFTVS
jgi:hypothetical protein